MLLCDSPLQRPKFPAGTRRILCRDWGNKKTKHGGECIFALQSFPRCRAHPNGTIMVKKKKINPPRYCKLHLAFCAVPTLRSLYGTWAGRVKTEVPINMDSYDNNTPEVPAPLGTSKPWRATILPPYARHLPSTHRGTQDANDNLLPE